MIEVALAGYDITRVICGGSPAHYGKRMGDEITRKAEFFHLRGGADKKTKYSFYSEPPDSPNQTIQVKDVDILVVGANARGSGDKEGWGKEDLAKEREELRRFLLGGEDPAPEIEEEINPGTDTNASSIVRCSATAGFPS